MDFVRTIFERLTAALFAAFLVFAGAMVLPGVARAALPSYASAMSSCQHEIQVQQGLGGEKGATCVNSYQPPNACQILDEQVSPLILYNTFPYDCSSLPPATPCANLPALSPMFLQGEVTNGQQITLPAKDPATGLSIRCAYTATNIGAPTFLYGKWRSKVTFTPNSNPAGGSGSTGQVTQPDGSPAPNAPPAVDPNNLPPSTAPQQCTTGTCYDVNTDTYNFCDGGGTCVSVPGNAARSASGGCNSSGSSAVCAGSPTAPLPGQPISDPATQIKNSDTYIQANPSTGANVSVTTVTYGLPGTTSTNGQKSGDVGPASSGSTGGSQGSVGGGSDCNSPPACSGDAVMCGVVRQQWYTMCSAKKGSDQLHKDLAGDGNGPSDLDALKSQYSQGDAWSAPDTSLDGTVGGQANKGVYDQSGFGWQRQCPIKDIPISLGTLGSFNVPASNGCIVGQWLSALIVGFALFSAAMITAGGRG